ncbi:B3/4 domain protein [Candidatus Terasakiella magnetica]|uniref:B3/4 domain protein n=1 Tax=Candidatus Terasakiella magnetica TaxID=1867952 RepID=A0A1C3RIR5_9PROT|nr:phenylalanine--tRNA ligase beta subunit-related protein [Candidatus Terasakiella magnetica]SCA57165.1 B3/4 domain protein [Candidatus Terasakiella magnetica]
MKISLSDDFAQRDIRLRLGLIQADVFIEDSKPEFIAKLDDVVERRIAEFNAQPASSDPQIMATRKAYKALGKDPARYRPAAEALTRRLLSGKGIYHVNNVVDVNNLISIKSGISIGTYITEKIEGDVIFRRANAGESYKGIGRGDLNLEGLPIFCDELGPFGCPTSDSERTMITKGHHTIAMVLINFGDDAALEGYLEETQALLKDYCQAENITTTLV